MQLNLGKSPLWVCLKQLEFWVYDGADDIKKLISDITVIILVIQSIFKFNGATNK